MRRRALRLALFAAVAIALLLVVAALTPIDEWLVAAAVGRAAGVEASIGELDWEWGGVLRVHELSACLPTASVPFFTASRATLELGLFPPRLERVVLERPHVVATEFEDGRIDLLDLERGGAGEGSNLPRMRVEGGVIELVGAGPLQRRLREFLAPSVAAHVAVDRLDVEPGDDGLALVTGALRLCGIVPLEVVASTRAGRLVGGSVRIEPSAAVDLVALQRSAAAGLADWFTANELAGSVHGAARLVDREGALVPSLDLELVGVTFRPEVFPVKLSRLHGRVLLRGDDLLIEEVRGRCGDAPLTASARIEQLSGLAKTTIVAHLDRATLDDDMRAALRTDSIGRMVLDSFAPAGRYSCTATVATQSGQDSPDLVLDIDLEEMESVFHGFVTDDGRRHGFTLPMGRIHGRVVASEKHSWFKDVVGFSASGARAAASAEIFARTLSGSVAADDIVLDDDLLAAVRRELGDVVPELVAELGLSGRFAAQASYALDEAQEFTLTIGLTPRAVTLAPLAFPYAVVLDAGSVEVTSDVVRIDGLRGTAGGGTVTIDGTVTLGADDPPFEVTARASGVAIDAALLAACHAAGGPELEARLAALAPSGLLDFEVRLVKPAPGAPLEQTVTLRPRHAELSLPSGLRVREVAGAILLTRRGKAPFAIDFESLGGLHGELAGGVVTLTGRSADGSDGSFEFVADAITLDAPLREVVAVQNQSVAHVLEHHRVAGAIRLRGTLELRGGEISLGAFEVTPARPRGAPIDAPAEVLAEPPWLPLPLSWRGGAMRVDLAGQRVTFDRLEGRLGDATLSVGAGSFAFVEQGLVARLDAEIGSLSFGEFLELVLGDAQRRALTAYGPLGRTHVKVHELTFELTQDGDVLERLAVRGDIDARGWTFYTGGMLRDLTGRLDVVELAYARDRGGIVDVRSEARLGGVTLGVGDLRFSTIDADLLLSDGRLRVPWFAGDFAGGRLLREKNHLNVDLAGPMPFDGQLDLSSADVSRLLGDDRPSMRSLVGRVDAAVGFRGRAAPLFRDGEITDLEAGGTLRIQDAKLWSIPVFDKLYSLAVLPLIGGGAAEPPRWTRGAIDFALQGVYVALSNVELEGEPLILRGEGTLGPDRLALDFYPEVRTGLGFVRDLPLVGWVADLFFSLLERQVGAFRFAGPYGSPEVAWNPVALERADLDPKLERPRTSARRGYARTERF